MATRRVRARNRPGDVSASSSIEDTASVDASRAFAEAVALGARVSSSDVEAWRASAVEDFTRSRREVREMTRERARERSVERRGGWGSKDAVVGVNDDGEDDPSRNGVAATGAGERSKTCVLQRGWMSHEHGMDSASSVAASLGRGREPSAKTKRIERRVDRRRRAAPVAEAARDACDADPECVYVDGASAAEHFPPNWMKVFAVKEALESEEYECDRVVWLDPDATFHAETLACAPAPSGENRTASVVCETTRRSVTDIIDRAFGDKDFFYAPESSLTSECRAGRRPQAFDAGVFGARNSPRGREIVDAWARLYPARAWSLSDDRPSGWRCETTRRKHPGALGHVKECPYEGVEYERGAFIASVLKTYEADSERLDPCIASAPCGSQSEATARGASFCHFSSCLGERYADGYLASTSADASADAGALGALARACPPRDVPSAGLATVATDGAVIDTNKDDSIEKSFFSLDADRALTIIFSALAFVVFFAVYCARRRARARVETAERTASESSPLV